MGFAQIFVLVILAFAVDALTWKNCDGSFPVKITEIKLSPDPLVLRKGARVTFGGKFKVAGDAGTQYKLHLSLKKKVWVWVPLPCIRNVGSCTYDIGCDKMKDLLVGAQCPLPIKAYTVNQREKILTDISVPSFLSSGTYKIKADLIEKGSTRRIACLEAELEIRH
ncbi:Ganglioside GM2 activator [Desmophyllum pertusum]|uniref:Ganglioside GM2 activator n=1 Tax=Desmophyllum pertusum TaxID=174260 RepID=A0A9X0CMU0_9CNID|nr:Ganglioside GM2 activator [Desmophyllum pertusum]